MKSNIIQRLFLTLTLCLVGVITSWADDGERYIIDGIVYTLDDYYYYATVTGYEKGITIANIRESVKEHEVKYIRYNAFYNCTSLTSVSIPSSVTSIEQSAFSGCTSLSSVTIPSSVTRIERSAFSGCTSLSSVTIPSSVYRIENSAFEGCTSLSSVTIPSSVTGIGESAFEGCI